MGHFRSYYVLSYYRFFYLLALVQMTAASCRLVCNAVTRSSSCEHGTNKLVVNESKGHRLLLENFQNSLLYSKIIIHQNYAICSKNSHIKPTSSLLYKSCTASNLQRPQHTNDYVKYITL